MKYLQMTDLEALQIAFQICNKTKNNAMYPIHKTHTTHPMLDVSSVGALGGIEVFVLFGLVTYWLVALPVTGRFSVPALASSLHKSYNTVFARLWTHISINATCFLEVEGQSGCWTECTKTSPSAYCQSVIWVQRTLASWLDLPASTAALSQSWYWIEHQERGIKFMNICS